MTDYERFNECRKRLWEMLKRVDFSDGCKSYEGTVEVLYTYPNYFESPDEVPTYELVIITLHCYVLGPSRHYDFKGKTLNEAVDKFEDWLDDREREEANNDD